MVLIMVGLMNDKTDLRDSSGLWLKSHTVCGNNIKTRAGQLWNNLETRTSGKHKDSCYDDCVNGFVSFQEFAEWCQKEHGYMFKEDNGRYWQLDKDILVQNNIIYSPDFCCFVPNKVNSVLIEQQSRLGLPTGVSYNTNKQRYIARYRNLQGVRVYIGVFDTPEDAHFAWYEYKQEVIKMVIQKFPLGEKVISALKERWDI